MTDKEKIDHDHKDVWMRVYRKSWKGRVGYRLFIELQLLSFYDYEIIIAT